MLVMFRENGQLAGRREVMAERGWLSSGELVTGMGDRPPEVLARFWLCFT